ncbi:HugZ family protein [Marinomonas ostreistagni]|uniref:HugZ family pyridoxamine 5'-phosphate oxidase n=1 Tax=Marinomonas ostreistagni TaxID=359209 RepID=UPI0019508A74|nr:pyridoxamine 5'-phosphate oxidase family protein [Marinomonas ostreistagni]MBM6549612.1 pyridoxamine 5'-phosphate oxidase family protein [Marinomonas ostreistagni]
MKNQRLAQELVEEIRTFLTSQLTLSLGLVMPDGKPIASYAPFAEHEAGLMILVSELAQHTQALQTSSLASVMIMEDEANCATVYARRRLQYEMQVTAIARETALWSSACAALQQRHGEIVDQLMQLGDFHLFKLSPLSGRFVKGFGRAYELPQNVLVGEQLAHLRG